MIRKLLSAVLFIVMLASCSTVRHTSGTVAVNNTMTTFTVADMDVSTTKVSKTTSWAYNPFKRVSIKDVKENTEAALVNENNADVLLEPQYIVERRGFMRGGSVTVTGFPAKYKNFHKMTPQEAEILKNIKNQGKCEKSQCKKAVF